MEEKDLKTSPKQRIIIGLIAFLLLGSSMAVYVAIVMGNDTIDYSKMTTAQLESAYEKSYSEYTARAAELSQTYFDEFSGYRSEVKGFNSAAANSEGVTYRDLKEGDGAEVKNGEYSAYYIGWCSDETIFDTSFDSYESPTSLNAPLAIEENSLIAGWYDGVLGMKLGGVREITIPGELAYGDTYEICGGYNSPLKFLVFAVPNDEQLTSISKSLNDIYKAMMVAYSQSYSATSDSSAAETSGE